MSRSACILLLVVLVSPAVSTADVFVTHDMGIPTPNLPGLRTVTVIATSTVPGEPIVGVDFFGNPNDSNPATASGFFGPLNQVPLFGQLTVFDLPSIAPIDPPPVPSPQDSHFLVREWTQTGIDIVVPAGFASEGAHHLRAIYAASEPIGQSIKVAQLVIPTAASGIINYRGVFAVMRDGTPVLSSEVTGTIVVVPEPAALCMAAVSVVVPSFRRPRRSRTWLGS